MPSPFPGMNPYLEQDDVWQDFHERLIPAISDALTPQVSPHFIVKIEEHIYLHEPDAAHWLRVGNPDVGVVRTSNASGETFSTPEGRLNAPQQILVQMEVEEERQAYLEIQDRQSREVVAVLEVLSPTNKRPGADREQYLRKRKRLLRSSAHLIEIDLLRGYPRVAGKDVPACDYCVLVSRANERPAAGLWTMGLRDRLPVIPVPLRAPLEEARVNLQEILHGVYDRASYRHYIYEGQPNPPLSPEDAAWAASLIANH